MDREFPFDMNARCDNCGAKGAVDFYGENFCSHCMNAMHDEHPDERPGLNPAFAPQPEHSWSLE